MGSSERVIGGNSAQPCGRAASRIKPREAAHLERWIAIDDDDEEWAESARGKLILTNPDKGVSDLLILERLNKLLM